MKKILRLFVFCLLLFVAYFLYTLFHIRHKTESITAMPEYRGMPLYYHVDYLATKIGSRSVFEYEKVRKTEEYIVSVLSEMGLTPDRQTFTYQGREFANIWVTMAGEKEETVVIGAHYDTVIGTPGADDNASGVAVLLEMARLLKGLSMRRTVRLIFFALEEPPLFRSPYMGSSVYAREAKARGEKIVAMLSLEMVGYFDEKKGSQGYPFPAMDLIYPRQGNFIAVVGDLASRRLVKEVAFSLRREKRLPVEYLAAPAFVPGIDFSDHLSFTKQGYPGIMITDTAFYRNPFYHTEKDTAQTLNYEKMALLLGALVHVVKNLADGGGGSGNVTRFKNLHKPLE